MKFANNQLAGIIYQPDHDNPNSILSRLQQFHYQIDGDCAGGFYGMDKKTCAKKWFLKTALAYLGTPYIWGGDDPSGFDCSGFVIECLKSAGFLRESDDHTADELMRMLGDKEVDGPEAGALLFLLSTEGRAVHVTICLDRYFHIGASGGDNHTKDRTGAWRDNAYVKIRPIRFDSERMRVLKLF